jgi:hypothetical protein
MTLPQFIHIPPQGIIKGVGIIMSTSEPFLYANILSNEEINKTLEAITYFFKTEKIAPNAGYYKKYVTA